MNQFSRRRSRILVGSLAVALPLALSACSGDQQSADPTAAAPGGECPADPVNVVVSVDQWGDIVSQLGGACANVTTVLAGSSVDPHDYEPAPSDAAAFDGAQLVVVNGGHYDEWATKLAASSAPDAPVINALVASGADDHEHAGEGHDHAGEGHDHAGEDHDHAGEDHDHAGDGRDHAGEPNPHVWYNPTAVTAVSDAVTAELEKLSPDAADYFGQRHEAFVESLKPYDDAIASLQAGAAGRTYAATESVFDDMASAIGLQNRTPAGYQVSSANETDPSPADLDAFLRLLGDRGVDVLIYNSQTEGSMPQQIRAAAEQAGVPVVEVTETVPPGVDSFETWQVGQLDALAEALGVGS